MLTLTLTRDGLATVRVQWMAYEPCRATEWTTAYEAETFVRFIPGGKVHLRSACL